MGRVNDVSNSGYAVGETLAGDGFIWHPSFDGVNSSFLGAQDFDDWLFAETGLSLNTQSISVLGISEDPFSGDLNFLLNGADTKGGLSSSYIVTVSSPVPEPSSALLVAALCAGGGLLIRRRRSSF